MRLFLSSLLGAAFVCVVPPPLHASYEIGSSPTFAVNREWDSSSLGIGLGLGLTRNDDLSFIGSGELLVVADVTVLRIYPVVTYRRYWGSMDVRPYLAARAGKDLVFAFAEQDGAEPYLDSLEESNDPFRAFLGLGLRVFLSDRVALAGEAGPDLRVERVNGKHRSTSVMTRFGILLQYHP